MSSEEDPVADFLARERSDLAGLDDEEDHFGPGAGEPTHENGDFPQMMNGFSNQNGMNNAISDDNEFFGQEPVETGGILNGGNIPSVREAAVPTPPPHIPRVEPEKIKKWREEQRNRLEKKDVQEEKEKQKWRDQAKRELDEWYKNRAEQLEKSKKNNKVTEQEFIRERDADRPGQEWERIARLCEFNPKSSKNTKDVSRMRSLLLQMKTTPIKREQ